MKYRTSLITLALLASLFTGCSKHSPDVAAVRPKISNLGVVEVSDGIPSRHELGSGRICVIKPTLKKDGSVLLAMTIEETDSTGATQTLASPSVMTSPDQAVEISIGDVGVKLTPHIKP